MEFQKFSKIPRLSRDVVVTEKIDGTNAQIYIGEDGEFLTGSRNRWITPEDDNYGFSRWAHDNKDEIVTLGPGRHFGEWWGGKIQRGYGLQEKRFSLFNVHRYVKSDPTEKQILLPECVDVVPVLWTGSYDNMDVEQIMKDLSIGSVAAPGFDRPEGIVIFHVAGGYLFKKTFENDQAGKGQ